MTGQQHTSVMTLAWLLKLVCCFPCAWI